VRQPEIQLGTWKFYRVMLEDKDLFKEFAGKTSWPVNLWSSNFPFIWAYAQSPRRTIFWKIIDDLLVTFIMTRKKKLSLLCLPFGRGDVHKLVTVLHKALQFCAESNSKRGYRTKIRTINECQLDYLINSERFERLFALKQLRGMEKHLSIPQLISLSGKKFNSIRKSINKFNRVYPEIKFREYRPTDFHKVISLNKNWEETSGKKYSIIFDRDYFNAIISHYRELNMIILVAVWKDEIVGVNIGSELPTGESWGCICKTLKGIEGLHETIIIRFIHEINKRNNKIQYMNVGSDLGIEGLRRFKEKFKPALDLKRYRIFLKQA
jgi:hypothetical protein